MPPCQVCQNYRTSKHCFVCDNNLTTFFENEYRSNKNGIAYSNYLYSQTLVCVSAEIEERIASNPFASLLYARNVLKGRFEKGEKILASKAIYAATYACEVLKGPFHEGEDVISKNGLYSRIYAQRILKNRFEKGENAIFSDCDKLTINSYILSCFHERSESFEELLIQNYGNELFNYIFCSYARKFQNNVEFKNKISTNADLVKFFVFQINRSPFQPFEKIFSEDAYLAYKYAREILKKRFESGEKIIATSAKYSYLYAKNVLKCAFPEGENEIFKSKEGYLYIKDIIKQRVDQYEEWLKDEPNLAYLYARNIIKNRFISAEDNILNNPKTSLNYAVYVAKRQFKACNQLLADNKVFNKHLFVQYAHLSGDKDELEEAIKNSSNYSYIYAKDILKGPFPLGEAAIAKNVQNSLQYARSVLMGRFILGEEIISNNEEEALQYTKNILLGRRFPLYEKKLLEKNTIHKTLQYCKNILTPFYEYEESLLLYDKYTQANYYKLFSHFRYLKLEKLFSKFTVTSEFLYNLNEQSKFIFVHCNKIDISSNFNFNQFPHQRSLFLEINALTTNYHSFFRYCIYTKTHFPHHYAKLSPPKEYSEKVLGMLNHKPLKAFQNG